MARRAIDQEDFLPASQRFAGSGGAVFIRLVQALHKSSERGQVRLRQAAPGWHRGARFPIPKNLAQQLAREPGGGEIFGFPQKCRGNKAIPPASSTVAGRALFFKQFASTIHLLRVFGAIAGDVERWGRVRKTGLGGGRKISVLIAGRRSQRVRTVGGDQKLDNASPLVLIHLGTIN